LSRGFDPLRASAQKNDETRSHFPTWRGLAREDAEEEQSRSSSAFGSQRQEFENKMQLPNKPSAKERELQAIAGIDKHFGNVTTVTFAGVSLTPTQMKGILQADISSSTKTANDHSAWQQSVKDEHTARVAATTLLRELKAFLILTYGAGAVGILGDFGFAVPKKLGKTSPKTKAAAVDKSKATRQARHTMGKVQKKAVKGTVEVPVTELAPAPGPTAGGTGTPNAGNGATGGPAQPAK
jgi:hypothetical protein